VWTALHLRDADALTRCGASPLVAGEANDEGGGVADFTSRPPQNCGPSSQSVRRSQAEVPPAVGDVFRTGNKFLLHTSSQLALQSRPSNRMPSPSLSPVP